METGFKKETDGFCILLLPYFCPGFYSKQNFNSLKMRKLSFSALAAAIFLISCQGSTGDKAATTTEQQVAEQKGATYTLDAAQSTLKWTGYHKGGMNPRFGTLKGTGTLAVENGAITGGSFTIDINSLVTDSTSVDPSTSGGKKSTDLDAHLKTGDFFEVEKHPTAKFDITSVGAFDAATTKSVVEGATNTISGNLTLKGKTVNVTFPAKVTVTGDEATLVSKFTINRQDWGLTYGTEGSPKDWMISQEVDIALDVKAKK